MSPLTVAVTGATGEIGRPFVRALEATDEVARIVAMARRPFDPKAHGWHKTDYLQGDILERAAVDRLVQDADVVVHLAFIIQAGADTRAVNVEGSRNVFEAAVAAGAHRLVYTSSVAAYGFHEDNPAPLTEDVAPRGSERHPYSAQKAEVEDVLWSAIDGSPIGAYVLRPCIVAGPDAPVLIDSIPYMRIGEKLPRALRELFDQVPILKPVLPDPGIPFQLVHHDDVAAALTAAVLGRGAPGIYNLAAPGELTMADIAAELGYYAIPVPDLAVDIAAEIVARLPFLPNEAQWIEAARVPVLMDCSRARSRLGWEPEHDAHQTLHEMVEAAREDLQPV
jgi:nucleoside-diphosphate-sugar epimerase